MKEIQRIHSYSHITALLPIFVISWEVGARAALIGSSTAVSSPEFPPVNTKQYITPAPFCHTGGKRTVSWLISDFYILKV